MKILALFFVMISVSACSMDASLMNLSTVDPTTKTQDPAKMTGLVSGSTQIGVGKDPTGVSTQTYRVQSTVGNYMSGIEQTTTDHSYRIYSSVQGAIVSN